MRTLAHAAFLPRGDFFRRAPEWLRGFFLGVAGVAGGSEQPYLKGMLILLSPAKNLDWSPAPANLSRTAPQLARQTAALAQAAKKLSVGDLKRLMGISDKLAALNHDRFAAFDPKASLDAGKQAALAFNGEVYLGLCAKTLSANDLAFAQDHVRILSGLYGVLRPLDAIQPYRLEMGARLKTAKGETLYDFWGDTIAKVLKADLAGHTHQAIVNLASDEYFSAVTTKTLGAPVITPRFVDVKDGKARSVFLFVKRARGLMARFAIEKRIASPEGLKAFSVGGYRFQDSDSTETAWTFSRKQPPAAGAKQSQADRA